MDYIEATVLIVVFTISLGIMGLILFDVGKDVMKAARKERRLKQAKMNVPDNVVQFSRENERRYKAIK